MNQKNPNIQKFIKLNYKIKKKLMYLNKNKFNFTEFF